MAEKTKFRITARSQELRERPDGSLRQRTSTVVVEEPKNAEGLLRALLADERTVRVTVTRLRVADEEWHAMDKFYEALGMHS